MPAAKTIEWCRQLAADRGGAFLSPHYIGSHQLHAWRCAAGHEWSSKPASIQQGHWCKQCSGKAPKDLAWCQELAAGRGGVCTSETYLGVGKQLWWRCAQSHAWKATPNSIHQGKWCGRCTRNKYSDADRERWAETYRAGQSLRAIAMAAGVVHGTVNYALTQAGVIVVGRRKKHASIKDANRFHALRRYGLDTEGFASMVQSQEGRCAICRRLPAEVCSQLSENLCVDHDHATGRVRALLCSECNTGLGKFSDDPARLRAGADYLERHRAGKAA